MKLATAALVLIVGSPAAAQIVTDGDTIKLDGIRWRLWGIDAPELHQTCADGWRAGLEATRFLERLMTKAAVRCEDRGHDRYGRSIGLCRTGGRDLGADMVSAGMAWAFNRTCKSGRCGGIAFPGHWRRLETLAVTIRSAGQVREGVVKR